MFTVQDYPVPGNLYSGNYGGLPGHPENPGTLGQVPGQHVPPAGHHGHLRHQGQGVQQGHNVQPAHPLHQPLRKQLSAKERNLVQILTKLH